jgi:hypothetical protein
MARSGVLFAEAEDVAIGVFHVEVRVTPWPRPDGLGDPRAARLQLLVQRLDAGDGHVGVEVLVLTAVRTVAGGLRGTLEMDQRGAPAHAGIKRLVGEIHREAEPIAVIGDRRLEVVHEKLGRDGLEMGGALNVRRGHVAVLSRVISIACVQCASSARGRKPSRS